MEANKSTDYFSIQPPKLEDAGLEDPALPIEGIQEAFRRVADFVQTKAGVSVRIANSSDGLMEDTVDGLPEPRNDGESCVDPVMDGALPGEDKVLTPPDETQEDLVLEKEEKGPKLGKEKCVIGDTDPIRDTRTF